MYADDMVLYRPIHSHKDYLLQQRDINTIADWIARLHLYRSMETSASTCFSRENRCVLIPYAMLLNGLPLERVSMYKYLGLHISSDLFWSLHIKTTCNNARKPVGMFHRRFFSIMDANINKHLYIAYIRPHLEYVCQVT